MSGLTDAQVAALVDVTEGEGSGLLYDALCTPVVASEVMALATEVQQRRAMRCENCLHWRATHWIESQGICANHVQGPVAHNWFCADFTAKEPA